MKERFAGLVLPLAKRSLPDFGLVFTRYADDLRRRRSAPAIRGRAA